MGCVALKVAAVRNAAPKARNMTARGKARSASPLETSSSLAPALKGRNTAVYFGLSGLHLMRLVHQGLYTSRLPLASILRAFGAQDGLKKQNCAPSAINIDF